MQTTHRTSFIVVILLLAAGRIQAAPAASPTAAAPDAMAVRAAAAFFHARLDSSVPAADDTLRAPLDTLRLVFSARVGLDFTRLALWRPAGDTVALVPAASGDDGRVIVAALPPLTAGAHVLDWRTTSADGHVLSGTIRFHVTSSAVRAPRATADSTAGASPGDGARAAAPNDGVTAPPRAAPARAAGALLPLLRATGTALLLMLAGALLFGARAPASAPGMRRVLTAVALAAPAAVVAELVVWTAQVTGAMDLGLALQLATGRALLARALFATAALAVFVAARAWRGAAALALAAVVAGGWLGHAAAETPLVSVPLRALHLAAAAVWLGGVLALVLALRTTGASARPLVRTVSAAALWSFAVVALTGAGQALVLLGSLDALLRTAYGRVVLVKATGLLALAAFGNHHRRLIARMDAAGDGAVLRASATRELLFFIGMIVVSAALSFLPLPE